MPLAPYQGMNLTPGMGAEAYSTDSDISDLIYGPLWNCLFLNYALIDGASRDAGNTNYTSVLRTGLVMGQVTASGKWKQFNSAASDGTEIARGILISHGLNTQMDGADADRWVATILVRGIIYAEGACLASSSSYGIARSSTGLTVRKHLMYAITFSDDFINDLTIPASGR